MSEFEVCASSSTALSNAESCTYIDIEVGLTTDSMDITLTIVLLD